MLATANEDKPGSSTSGVGAHFTETSYGIKPKTSPNFFWLWQSAHRFITTGRNNKVMARGLKEFDPGEGTAMDSGRWLEILRWSV
jgi:hypothetical protein